MKKVKKTSTQRCSYCKERAEFKTTSITFLKYACESHKGSIEALDKEDNYMTEGDYQSWGRKYG